jgi:hypothetical protein
MKYNVEAVAEELLGTDQSLDDVVGNHLTEDWSFKEELRDHAVRCASCHYWFVPEEVDSDDTCDACG